MHKAALKHIGREGDYRLIDVGQTELDAKLASLHKEGYQGFNVTIPHKRAVFANCVGKTDEAARTRAVNTVKVYPDGKMIGHNTDLPAFKQALENNYGNRNRVRAMILGAGGAARAAVAALVDLDFQNVQLLVRTPEKHSLSDFFYGDKLIAGQSINIVSAKDFLENEDDIPQLVINCTPLGQAARELPDWVDALFKRAGERAFFFDMVYSKEGGQTPMIEAAQKHGLACVDGLEMLARQAALAFEFWTEESVPPDVMLNALKELNV